MTIEEVKEELKKFDKFKFFSNGHYYECNGQRVGISVTSYIGKFENEFEKDIIAEKCAIKAGKETYEILEEWEYKNKFACAKGSNGHAVAQSLWSGITEPLDRFDNSEAFKNACAKVFQQAKDFYEDYKGQYVHIQDEQVIGSEEYDIASAIDHIMYDKINNKVALVDYKTNSILKGYNDDEKSRKYAKPMKVPLNEIKDDALHHYYLQLSIYKYIVEKYTNIRFDEMFIIYFSENIDHYERIEIPYLKEEAEKMLELRRVKNIMGKSIPVLVIGHSGSGKSASLRNLKTEDYSLINPLAKKLPFKGGQAGYETANYEEIKNFIAKTPKKIVIVDDSNYLLTIEMMNRAKEAGYNKFTDIALNYWKLIEFIKNLDGDKRVYLMSHEEIDEYGNVGVKTVGKMLANQCCIEGLYTVVLRAESANGKFLFRTKTAGNDIVKTPIGMFEEETIDNDLAIVDKAICEYYEIKNEVKEEK